MPQTPLTDLPKVQDYLRSGVQDKDRDTIERFISIASRLIRVFTKRRFTIGATSEERTYLTYGRDSLYVDELMSANNIVSVVDGAGLSIPYEVELDDREGEVRGATLWFGTYDSLSGIRGLSVPDFPPDHADLFIREVRPGAALASPMASRVKVTANFGWPQVPEDIQFAATRAAALWFKEEIAHYTDDAFISRGERFEPEVLPPLTMALIRGAGWVVEDPVVV